VGDPEETMNRSQSVKRLAKDSALYISLAVAVIVAIPVLAVLAYGVRLLVPFVLLAGLLAVAVSPAFRRWFVSEAKPRSQRHGLAVPSANLLLHPAHAWVSLDGQGRATVGIDALAAAALGPVTAVEAAAVGSRVEQGQAVCTLFHGQRRLQVLAPASGEIARLNPVVSSDPSAVSRAPYAGWLVELTHAECKRESLVAGAAIGAWFGREVDRLVAALGSPAAAASMADGGVLHSDLSSAIDEAKWDELGKTFFA
jgi:glycine cleavage system H lipoate-binding protein